MKIGIGSDESGHHLKNIVADHLRSQGHEVQDFGYDDTRLRRNKLEAAGPITPERKLRSVTAVPAAQAHHRRQQRRWR